MPIDCRSWTGTRKRRWYQMRRALVGAVRWLAAAALLLVSMAGVSVVCAQPIREQRLAVSAAAPLLMTDQIVGSEIVDYIVAGEQSQILSVDIMTSGASAYFNITPTGSDTALFIGSTSGDVADISLPAAADYTIRVYLMRSAARRSERSDYSLAIGIGGPDFADGLAGGPDFWRVAGVGGGDALNVRAGPSTRYAVVSKLRNGDVLENRGCRMSGTERWCQIRTVGSGVMGWVAGRYLAESAPPPRPQMPPGGPVGNGRPFDATGRVACTLVAGGSPRDCIFGVIRQGPGNAGVWIAIGSGAERHILFEAGRPVTTNAAAELTVEKAGDLYRISIGAERYEIPEAVVYGG